MAAAVAAAAGGPTIATAGLATAVGFLVLLLSPVPMVRGFGLRWCARHRAGARVRAHRRLRRAGALQRRPSGVGGAARVPAPAEARARRRRLTRRVAAGPRVGPPLADGQAGRRRARRARGLAYAVARPRRVLAVGLAVAIAGWAVDTQSEVVSDVRELVPQDLQALKDVNTLQDGDRGVGRDRRDGARRRHHPPGGDRVDDEVPAGHAEGRRLRGRRHVPPGEGPARAVPGAVAAGPSCPIRERGQPAPDQHGLLDAIPAYFSQGVVTADRTTANLAFGIRLQSLDDQKRVVDQIKDRLDPPRASRPPWSACRSWPPRPTPRSRRPGAAR